jgi:translation initiation factor IF-2
MAEEKSMRLRPMMQELNVGLDTIVNFLASKGLPIQRNPMAVLSDAQYALLRKEFASSAAEKKEAQGRHVGRSNVDNIVIDSTHPAAPGKKKSEDDDDTDIWSQDEDNGDTPDIDDIILESDVRNTSS